MERQVAIVAYQGVLADESHAFRAVLGRAPDVHLVTVGAAPGRRRRPGRRAGRRRHVRRRPPRLDRRAARRARQPSPPRDRRVDARRRGPGSVLTSSTGSALLAAAGVLRGRTAATHWLAGPLLERHGVTVSHERIVVDGPFVTCHRGWRARSTPRSSSSPGSGARHSSARIRERAGDGASRGAAVRGPHPLPGPARRRPRRRPSGARPSSRSSWRTCGPAAGGDSGHDPRHGARGIIEPWPAPRPRPLSPRALVEHRRARRRRDRPRPADPAATTRRRSPRSTTGSPPRASTAATSRRSRT